MGPWGPVIWTVQRLSRFWRLPLLTRGFPGANISFCVTQSEGDLSRSLSHEWWTYSSGVRNTGETVFFFDRHVRSQTRLLPVPTRQTSHSYVPRSSSPVPSGLLSRAAICAKTSSVCTLHNKTMTRLSVQWLALRAFLSTDV